VAIGGIDLDRAAAVRAAGADAIAVIGALADAPAVSATTRALRNATAG
jgi:thiamine monophosphate synthase